MIDAGAAYLLTACRKARGSGTLVAGHGFAPLSHSYFVFIMQKAIIPAG